MLSLQARTMVVIGGSRGFGRQLWRPASEWRRVLAVARGEGRLATIARELPGSETPVARRDRRSRARKSVRRAQARYPRCRACAFPPAAPLHEQNWHEFAVNWRATSRSPFIS